MLTGSVNADARIRAAQETIYRLLQRDTLARSLRNRASQEELRGSGILREGSLVRERGLRDLLSHFLHTRPAATSLFSREVLKGVLMLWTQLEVWPPPSPRHYHTLTLVGRRVVLLGGLEGGEAIAPLAPVLLDADSGHWSTPRATSSGTPTLASLCTARPARAARASWSPPGSSTVLSPPPPTTPCAGSPPAGSARRRARSAACRW